MGNRRGERGGEKEEEEEERKQLHKINFHTLGPASELKLNFSP